MGMTCCRLFLSPIARLKKPSAPAGYWQFTFMDQEGAVSAFSVGYTNLFCMDLNHQQKKAVAFDGSHVLVLAGAGTGKTRTIIARAAHLIENHVPPWRILLLTFTRRAAREMVERLDRLVGPESSKLPAGTFHHYCLQTMRRMADAFGIRGATVIDRDDQVQLMKLIRSDFKGHGKAFPRAAELVNLCSYARNTLQPIKTYLEMHTEYDGPIIEKICQINDIFNQKKLQNDYLDYDDILFRFVEKIQVDKALSDHIRGMYDHILVDEMQDTNPLQWQILEGLRDPARLFCVGDDAQSIYAFRGADFKNVHAFTERIPSATVLHLEENFRSTQGILDLSNWLLGNSPISYDKKLRAHREELSTPLLVDFNSDLEEARWITDDLLKRQVAGNAWHEMMIITRTGYGARAVESIMVEKDIPYQFIGGASLLQSAHVKDLLCLVRAGISHLDELAWARYLTLWPRIGNVTAARLIDGMKQQPTTDTAFSFLEKKLKGREEIINGPRKIQDHLEVPAEAISAAADILLPFMEVRYENWRTRLRDFELLIRLADTHRSLNAFLETYTLDPISTTSAQRMGQNDVVTLTTVHSAKGTEASVCYLIRVEPGMYPHQRSMGSEAEQEEERRILYVAMTRAQDELILTRTYNPYGFRSSSFGGGWHWSQSNPSNYFMEDLPDTLVEAVEWREDDF
jgi:ATP-dependent DNA helicase UvrD/PcrA